MVYQQLQNDVNKAMVAHKSDEVEALRYLLAQIKNLSIDLKKDPSDEDVVNCIRKQVKQLTESAELFNKNKREDLAKQYENQIKIYSTYLPQEINDATLKVEVEKLLASGHTLDKQFLGIAVGRLKDKASPSRIVAVVQALMAQK